MSIDTQVGVQMPWQHVQPQYAGPSDKWPQHPQGSYGDGAHHGVRQAAEFKSRLQRASKRAIQEPQQSRYYAGFARQVKCAITSHVQEITHAKCQTMLWLADQFIRQVPSTIAAANL